MTELALFLLMTSVSAQEGIPHGLLSSICYVESRHKTKAINKHDGLLRNGVRGAEASIGLCQIKLATAKQFDPHATSKKLLNSEFNIRISAKYLRWQLDRYDNDIPCAVAAYNAGSCRRNTRGLIKNRMYVGKVFDAWKNEK